MKGKFHCTGCGTALTGELEILSLKDPGVTKPRLADLTPVCEPGAGYKSYEPLLRSFDSQRPAKLEFRPQFWLNPKDVEGTTERTAKAGRLNGCCGLDGCDGPNLVCKKCGAEIGTLQSDCWTPLIFVPDNENTEFRKEQ